MSGHSKWATTKHKKAIVDAKRAKVFTKLAKDIMIMARNGSNPETNFQLKLAMERAKAANVPKENIERAIKKGAGELKDGEQIEEVAYEAYGPGQVAMLIKTATDNKNRTLGEVKNVLNKNGGKFAEGGSVSWQFEQVGSLLVSLEGKNREEAEEKIIESGARDYEERDGYFYVFTLAVDLQKVKEFLEQQGGLIIEGAGLVYIPKNKIEIDENTKIDYEKLLDALDDHDDVAEIWDNLNSRS